MNEVERVTTVWLLTWLIIILGIAIVVEWRDQRAHDRYKSIREFDFEAEE